MIYRQSRKNEGKESEADLDTLTRREFFCKVKQLATLGLMTTAFSSLESMLACRAYTQTLDRIVRNPEGKVARVHKIVDGIETETHHYIYERGKLIHVIKEDRQDAGMNRPAYEFHRLYDAAWDNVRIGNIEQARSLANHIVQHEPGSHEMINGLIINIDYQDLKIKGYKERRLKSEMNRRIRALMRKHPGNEFLEYARVRFSMDPGQASRLTGESWELYRIAQQHYNSGELMNAESIIRSSLEIDPHNIGAWMMLATIKTGSGEDEYEQKKKTLSVLNEGLQYNPRSNSLLTEAYYLNRFLKQ